MLLLTSDTYEVLVALRLLVPEVEVEVDLPVDEGGKDEVGAREAAGEQQRAAPAGDPQAQLPLRQPRQQHGSVWVPAVVAFQCCCWV